MSAVHDNLDKNRFEMPVDGEVAYVTYRRQDGIVTLLHAQVPAALEGRGIGSKLVQATLEAIRGEGLKVVPRCSFVAAYIDRHPEVQDLLAHS